ncbi:MAG TPA: TetR/AcrR family transcriptional regulator [Nocardioidaceae bacterium]|nr:TetR/AcrR family transcriptional regulator [Nocardioidaceae bacterium]
MSTSSRAGAAAPARIRMTPHGRREQLLDLGVELLSTRSLDELSIETLAEEAGVSRGLLYHYFGSKRDFHRAVVQRAADDLIRVTAPASTGEPLERLTASLAAYVDYVQANYAGYISLVRGAAGGDEDLREIYEQARAALTDRIFDESSVEPVETTSEDLLGALGPADTPAARLMARGWAALVEDVVLAWVRNDHGMGKQDLLARLAAALPGVLGRLPSP